MSFSEMLIASFSEQDKSSMPTRHSVTVGSARFSLLTPHLLRLQYAPFDDRRSMRVYSRPNAIPAMSSRISSS